MFTLYCSNLHTPIVIKDRGCRTQEQFEAVQTLLPEIDFVCNNPFEGEHVDSQYERSFAFVYYAAGVDRRHGLRLANITPKGRITRTIGLNEKGQIVNTATGEIVYEGH